MKNLIPALICLFLIIPCQAGVIYVDANAALGGDGATWGTAYKYLQDAFYKPASSGDEIWVAEGTYKPDQDEGGNVTPGDRNATFELKNGVSVYGGFPIGGGTWESRDPNQYETILSGDLSGDDGPDFVNNSENSYHVIMVSATSSTATLDGLTISGGNASDDFNINGWGSGVYVNSSGKLLVENCRFVNNSSAWGGAVLLEDMSNVDIVNTNFASNRVTATGNSSGGGALYLYKTNSRIINCTFTNNKSLTSAGLGGAVFLDEDSSSLNNCRFVDNNAPGKGGAIWCNECKLIWCTFIGNSSAQGGGAYFNGYTDDPFVTPESYPTVINNTFVGNTAGSGGGGAIHSYSATRPTLINCEFAGNYTEGDGGAINVYCYNPTVTNIYFKITNCSFSGNKAEGSGGAYAIYSDDIAETTITNTILWGNLDTNGSGESSQVTGGTLFVSSSCIQDDNPNDANIPFGGALNNNIDDNPNFVRDPNDGGDGWGVGDNDDFGDLHLLYTSPCIDAADNTSVPPDTADLDGNGNTVEPTPLDLDDNPRFFDDPVIIDTGIGTPPLVDMGAYEFQEIPGDFEPDGDVDANDLDFFTDHWLYTDCNDVNDWCEGTDLDYSHAVDFDDFAILAKYWQVGKQLYCELCRRGGDG